MSAKSTKLLIIEKSFVLIAEEREQTTLAMCTSANSAMDKASHFISNRLHLVLCSSFNNSVPSVMGQAR